MSKRFSNDLTEQEAELFAALAEEAGEIVQIVGKILRHGLYSHHPSTHTLNAEALRRELGDLWAVRRLLVTECDVNFINDKHVNGAAIEKLLRIGKYLHHTRIPSNAVSVGELNSAADAMEGVAPRFINALERIRRAGNNADATAIWMQKVAAHALFPLQWPDPGEVP